VTIEMNTRTSLSLRKDEPVVEAIELIAGEAAVATSARSVVVHAGNGQISATSAQFNVRCDDREVRVTCLGGLAEVAYEGRTVAIGPRQQVVYAARNLGAVVSIDPDAVAGWRNGLLIFQNERLADVIDEVN